MQDLGILMIFTVNCSYYKATKSNKISTLGLPFSNYKYQILCEDFVFFVAIEKNKKMLRSAGWSNVKIEIEPPNCFIQDKFRFIINRTLLCLWLKPAISHPVWQS